MAVPDRAGAHAGNHPELAEAVSSCPMQAGGDVGRVTEGVPYPATALWPGAAAVRTPPLEPDDLLVGEGWDDPVVTPEVDWAAWERSVAEDEVPDDIDWDSWSTSGPVRAETPSRPDGDAWTPAPEDAAWLLPDEPDEPRPAPVAEDLDLSKPLPASGGPWPAPSRTVMGIDQVELPRVAPFVTGFVLAAAVAIIAIGLVLNGSRVGFGLAAANGRGAATSDQVVRSYLTALADLDGPRALSYFADPPTNTTLLTPSVMVRSAERARLSIIRVDKPTSTQDGGEKVSATYRLGDTTITSWYTTTHRGGSWRINELPGTLGVASLRSAGSALFVNGVEIRPGVDVLPAFPGVYLVETSNKDYLRFAGTSYLMVRGPGAAPVVGGARLEVTEKGVADARKAVEAAIARCVEQRDLQPTGCPQSATPNPGEPVIAGSVRWSIDPTPQAPTLVTSPDARAASVEVTHAAYWKISADVISNGRPASISSDPWSITSVWMVDLTKPTLTATVVSVRYT